MSIPGLSHPSAIPHPTRQQLDELDALLQQMLGLPVHPPSEDWEPPPANLPPPADHAPSLSVAGEASSEAAAPIETAPPALALPPVPPVLPALPAPGSFSARARSAAAERIAIGSQQPPMAVWLWPVVGVNLLFDGLTYLLGPLGRWLRGSSGRALLGWIGLGLLAAAAAWALADWLAWIW